MIFIKNQMEVLAEYYSKLRFWISAWISKNIDVFDFKTLKRRVDFILLYRSSLLFWTPIIISYMRNSFT